MYSTPFDYINKLRKDNYVKKLYITHESRIRVPRPYTPPPPHSIFQGRVPCTAFLLFFCSTYCFIQLFTFYSVIYILFSHLHFIQSFTFYSVIYILFSHLHFIQSFIFYSVIYILFSHLHFIQSFTCLFSHLHVYLFFL